ncbi:regulator of G-protein signaling 22 [Clinocottus analis]|uniref:regulator of G-protein signaling 22 n=1 Tax=Clinocottus analis TaxID=304258 RepID=UPI0035C083ED
MCELGSAEFPDLADDFETHLASDEVLAHYFNEFLNLPCFPQPLLYNQQTGLFELVDGAEASVSRRIRSVLHRSKSQLLTGDPAALARTPPVDNQYTVSSLDREQGLQWIKRERLPFFLHSDCYTEYRLSKLLFQKNSIFCIQRRKGASGRPAWSAPQRRLHSQFDTEHNQPLQRPACSQENTSARRGSLGSPGAPPGRSVQKEHVNTTCSERCRCFSSCSEHENPCGLSSSSCPSNLGCEEPQGPPTEQRATPELQLEDLAARTVQQALNRALDVMDGPSRAKEKTRWSQNGREGSRGTEQENTLRLCCHGTRCRDNGPGLDELKDFLRGTPGEKLLDLWTDIARLKAARSRERKSRSLVLMRSRYLLSSSRSGLHVQLLNRLELTTSPCWTEEKLLSVQPVLTESLLHYWVPRFWTSRWLHPELWTGRCARPRSDAAPPPGSLALTCDPGRPRYPHAGRTQVGACGRDSSWCVKRESSVNARDQQQTVVKVVCQFSWGRSQSPGSSRMEKMLQALSVDSCAGFYFTNFCEQSGNQLWENAVNLWADLQQYRGLFYRDGLDPYRVQREAQLLYSTYLSASARRSVGVGEEIRREVYDRLTPAFEQLFDPLEERSLGVLLEPWTLLLSSDQESFLKVCVQEEVRCIDSQEFRELQSLYEESNRRLKQVEQWASTPSPSPGPRAPDSWSRVPSDYRGYRLGSLLRLRHEIGHFMSFLQNQDASIHLACWLDLEQYRRTAHTDRALRQERSSRIATKYLSGTYFFGSGSPATTEQQNDILRLAGGLERLKLEGLSHAVVVEIQDVIRSHIETRWLPLFLSTAEFTKRLRRKPKLQAADRLSQHVHRRRARREAWKAESLWMSSSKEILLFRRGLLDPAACTQFQHFVSLKGDFLENDVRFWLEVQRYKDLCHSHSDEATIQQKISTIISCFLDSSMPPALQVDVPPAQAQQVLDKRHALGPYIFREAQLSVFSVLLKFWPEFQELSSSVQEEQLLPLLQEKRVKHRARVRRQRREEEEEEEEEREERRRRAQEELESQESSPEEEGGDEDDVEEEQEGKSVKQQSRAQSRLLLIPTQPLSWSYSKYVAALKREEVLLRRQSQPGASFSTASD